MKRLVLLLSLLPALVLGAPATLLYEGTGATGAAVASGTLDVSNYDCVHVSIKNSGSAVSGACSVTDARTTDLLVATFTVAIGTTSYAGSICPGLGATNGISMVPPPKIAISCAGAANATLRLTVYGK